MNSIPTTKSNTIREFESSVSPKGQITIPIEVRKKLGVEPKDKVIFRVDNDEVKLMPPHSSLEDIYMSVPALKTPKTLAEMREIYQEELAERFAKENRETTEL